MPISARFMDSEETHFSLAGKSSHQSQRLVPAPAMQERMNRSRPHNERTVEFRLGGACIAGRLDQLKVAR